MNEKELYQSVIIAKLEGNYDEAIQILTRLIDTYPGSWEAETAQAIRYDLKEGNNNGSGSASVSVSDVSENESGKQKVIVTDIQMPFESMVVFMIKWALASIPAIIILVVLFGIVAALFGGIFGGSRY